MIKKILLFLGLINSFTCLGSDTTYIKGNVLLQGNYTSGNYNSYTIGFKSDIRYNDKNNVYEISPAFRYTENGFIRNSKPDSFALKENEKYNVMSYSHLWNKFKFIALSEQEQSFLRKINLRYNLGIGAGYKFLSSKQSYLEVSEVLLPENVIYQNSAFNITSLRYSTRVKFYYEMRDDSTKRRIFSISNILLVQPSIWNSQYVNYMDNLNIRNSTSFDVCLYKELSLGISNDYVMQSYVHVIFPSKRIYDNTVMIYIKLSF